MSEEMDKETMSRVRGLDIHTLTPDVAVDIIAYRLAVALGFNAKENGKELMHLNKLLDAVEVRLADWDVLFGGIK